MARLPRVVIVDVAHHVTQRGNGRHFILDRDADRMVYLDLLRQTARVQSLSVEGYCLMSNHVRVVVVPRRRALRNGRPRPLSGNVGVAPTLVGGQLAELLAARRNAI
jgi:putative transposase